MQPARLDQVNSIFSVSLICKCLAFDVVLVACPHPTQTQKSLSVTDELLAANESEPRPPSSVMSVRTLLPLAFQNHALFQKVSKIKT